MHLCSYPVSVGHKCQPMPTNRTIDPIVSTDWLAENRADEDLVVVDVRGPGTYPKGHVPGALGASVPTWVDAESDLLMTTPAPDDLADTLGSLGITADARVVVVGSAGDDYSRADPVAVADTLRYAGVDDVAVLDGGYDRWVDEGRPTEEGDVEPTPVDYDGRVREGAFVTKAEVEARLGECALVDARDPGGYFGLVLEEFTERRGHIPGATCLPTPWLWTDEGTFRPAADLEAMAEGVVGDDRSTEAILYCGASPYSMALRYVLQERLGYENLAVYDGAAEEWSSDPEAPLNRYCWE